ncbi:hypothetical protein BDY21DRAFT_422399 [Lineolata rhizophorae]|uniref:Uncharacterized protein n=1 Tax=Lineolata rhizophorae TaxID=578093 RepID=A0A6A6NWC5_9PEZI|nr:hypothetical protein BDY21DRAFT_422399 [Lineolata rhizophorae]
MTSFPIYEDQDSPPASLLMERVDDNDDELYLGSSAAEGSVSASEGGSASAFEGGYRLRAPRDYIPDDVVFSTEMVDRGPSATPPPGGSRLGRFRKEYGGPGKVTEETLSLCTAERLTQGKLKSEQVFGGGNTTSAAEAISAAPANLPRRRALETPRLIDVEPYEGPLCLHGSPPKGLLDTPIPSSAALQPPLPVSPAPPPARASSRPLVSALYSQGYSWAEIATILDQWRAKRGGPSHTRGDKNDPSNRQTASALPGANSGLEKIVEESSPDAPGEPKRPFGFYCRPKDDPFVTPECSEPSSCPESEGPEISGASEAKQPRVNKNPLKPPGRAMIRLMSEGVPAEMEEEGVHLLLDHAAKVMQKMEIWELVSRRFYDETGLDIVPRDCRRVFFEKVLRTVITRDGKPVL